MKNDPAIKMLLRYRKNWLEIKAEELNLSTEGTRLDIATRIADKQEKEQIRIWTAIANPQIR